MLAISLTACCSSRGHVQKKLLTGSRRGVNGTRLRQWWLEGYTQVWQIPGTYRSIGLGGKENNLHFDPPKLGNRPPRGELIAPLYHSLLLLR